MWTMPPVAATAEPGPRSNVWVRAATGQDWAQLWPIWRDVVEAGDTYAYDPRTSYGDARAAWGGGQPGHETWLAETRADTEPGKTVVGMYHIAPNQDGPGSHVANGSYMVAAGARRMGVGRALVEHSLRRCTEIGFRAFQFNAVAESNTGAIELYERLGFTTVGVVPQAFANPRLGLVGLRVMHRLLP